MKRFARAMQGVTLLEIMLVLAIAAMIIVMSVRYYQSATASQQANAVMEQIQSITAAADSLAQATGSYSQITTAILGNMLPGGASAGLTTAWGSSITFAAGGTASSYTISIGNVPTSVCPLLVSKLAVNNHYTALSPANAGACSGPGTVSYTYIANP